jgi:branched-chain amino acid transport system permease protein
MPLADRRSSAAVVAAGWMLAAVAVALFVPALLDGFWIYIATSAVIFALIAQSVGVVTGLAGMMTLCQLSFAGIGAWLVAWLGVHTSLPFLVQILAGGLIAVPFGVLIGLPALRLRGINLAVVTLAFGSAVSTFLLTTGFPGAEDGRPILPPTWLSGEKSYFLLCWVIFVVVAGALAIVRRRPAGGAWVGSRYSERATASMGRSVTLSKLTAFAVGAFMAGMAGGLTGGQIGLLTASNFEIVGSLTVFAAAIMVGAQLPEGALLAGALYAFLPEILRRLSIAQDLGALLFAVGAIDSLRHGGGGGAGMLRDKIAFRRQAKLRPPHRPSLGVATTSRPHAPSARPVLVVQDVAVRYGSVHALDGVSLTVPEGAIVGLIGPNGAGKSTLIDVISGFVVPASGTVSVDGRVLDGLAPHRRARAGLRRTFQQDRTIPDLTVGDYVRLAAGRPVPEGELEDLLGVLQAAHPRQRISTVDLAHRRLVELVGAIAAQPRVLLLDEPAAGLTPDESRNLADVLCEIPRRFGSSILVVEHDVELVQRACASITVLDFGKTIASGPPAQVLESTEVVDAYLGRATVTA